MKLTTEDKAHLRAYIKYALELPTSGALKNLDTATVLNDLSLVLDDLDAAEKRIAEMESSERYSVRPSKEIVLRDIADEVCDCEEGC